MVAEIAFSLSDSVKWAREEEAFELIKLQSM